jgi:hypothetical protein
MAADRPEVVETGKAMRHVKVRTVPDARSPSLRALIRTVLALDQGD